MKTRSGVCQADLRSGSEVATETKGGARLVECEGGGKRIDPHHAQTCRHGP